MVAVVVVVAVAGAGGVAIACPMNFDIVAERRREMAKTRDMEVKVSKTT